MPSLGKGDGKTLALLTAAYPREQITVGNSARLFERAVKAAPLRGTAGAPAAGLCVGTPAWRGRADVCAASSGQSRAPVRLPAPEAFADGMTPVSSAGIW